MSSFAFLEEIRQNPILARTPRAAFTAANAGFLSPEAMIYVGASVKPLLEEPYDLGELQRVLAQPELSFKDALGLAEIFFAITKESDKERALIGAESLMGLENRWAAKVEALRRQLKGHEEDEDRRCALAEAVYEQAFIAGQNAPIRNYYLREAYYLLDNSARPGAVEQEAEGRHGPALRGRGLILRLRCLLKLGLTDQAETEISQLLKAGELSEEEEQLCFELALEAAYIRRDVKGIRSLIKKEKAKRPGLFPGESALPGFWIAGSTS